MRTSLTAACVGPERGGHLYILGGIHHVGSLSGFSVKKVGHDLEAYSFSFYERF